MGSPREGTLRVAICTAVAGVGAAVVYAAPVQATPQSGLTSRTLAKAGVEELNLHADGDGWSAKLKTHGLSDGYVVSNVIAPGGTTGWHSHPGPSLIFVVRGTVTNSVTGEQCGVRDYAAGQSFVDTGGKAVHMLTNGGTEEAETIAVQLVPQNATRRLDAPGPAACKGGARG